MSNDDKYILAESSTKYSSNTFEDEYSWDSDSFLFAIQKIQQVSVFQGELSDYTENLFHILQETSEKELFYVKAIKNLLKQKDYINLMYQVSNELITEDEFSKELEDNEDKYLININEKLNFKSFKLITSIINKIGLNFTDDDISEIFSIRTNNIQNILSNNKELEK